MDFIEIKFRDFTSLVKRRDIKSPTWFAVPNDLLTHPDFFYITGNELKAFLWICGVASKLNLDRIRVYPKLCAQQLNFKEKEVHSCIEKLTGKRWDVTATLHARTESGLHTTEQNTTEHYRTEQTTTAVATEVAPSAAALNSLEGLISSIPENTKSRWLGLYKDKEFLTREITKAWGYYHDDNPKKEPKSLSGWCRALSSWFERGWTTRARTIPGKQNDNITADSLMEMMGAKNEAG